MFSKTQKDFNRIEELDTILIEASSPNLIKARKNKSEKPLRSLVDVISDEYILQIKEMENKRELQVIPTNEVGRMNFYLWRLIELVDKLQAIEDAVTQFGEKLRADNTWQYRNAIGHVLAYPFYDIYLVFRDLTSGTLIFHKRKYTHDTNTIFSFLQATTGLFERVEGDLAQRTMEVPSTPCIHRQCGQCRFHI